jgi:hypothetical protein
MRQKSCTAWIFVLFIPKQMKFRNYLLAPFILLLVFPVCFAQTKPLAELVETIGDEGCDNFLGLVDYFLAKNRDDPTSVGYAVIHPGPSTFARGARIERLIRAQIFNRKADPARLHIVRSNPKDAASVDLWLVPAGAETPSFPESKWTLPPVNLKKPFIFSSIFIDTDCPIFIPEDYAKLINENKNIRGHIVVINFEKTQARKEARGWSKILTRDNAVPRNKLRVFYAHNKNPANQVTEFWIVPTKHGRRKQ